MARPRSASRANPAKAPPGRALRSVRAVPAGEVRIVGGQWRRTRIAVLDRAGLRPTPDRVRETLFNWLGQDLTGWRCVDAFAGTGALGFEAASRGAAEVLSLEQDALLAERLGALKARLSADAVRVVRGDGAARLAGLGAGSIDLALLDPPFEDAALAARALAAAARAVRAGGFVYLEAAAPADAALVAQLGLTAHRHLKAGAVHAQLFVVGDCASSGAPGANARYRAPLPHAAAAAGETAGDTA